jgi:hypothetical protein
MRVGYESRLGLIVFAATILLNGRPAAAQQPTYDARSGNYTTHQRNSDGSTDLFGCNPRTNATWYEKYRPDQSILSIKKDGLVTLYEPESDTTRQVGRVPKIDASADPACPPQDSYQGHDWLHDWPVRFVTEEELMRLHPTPAGSHDGTPSQMPSNASQALLDDATRERSDQARRDYERAAGIIWGPTGCLAAAPAATCAGRENTQPKRSEPKPIHQK